MPAPLIWQNRDFTEQPMNPWWTYNPYQYSPLSSMIESLKTAKDLPYIGNTSTIDMNRLREQTQQRYPNLIQYGNETRMNESNPYYTESRPGAAGTYLRATNTMTYPEGMPPNPTVFAHETAHSYADRQSPEWWNQYRDVLAENAQQNTPLGNYLQEWNILNSEKYNNPEYRLYKGTPQEMSAFIPTEFSQSWGDIDPRLQQLYAGYMRPENYSLPQEPTGTYDAFDRNFVAPQQYADYINQPSMGHGPHGVPWWQWEGQSNEPQ